ncbi:MAG: PilZ domain-containing protein [Terriglobia bacterium]
MSPRAANLGQAFRSFARRLFGNGRSRRWVERDPRHAMRAPVLYRQQGGLFWYNGVLEDFSLTGVRFRGEKYIPLQSPLEMTFEAPLSTGDQVKASFFCWATTVRAVLPSLNDSQFGIGARILRYRSQTSTAGDFRQIIGEVRGPYRTRDDKARRAKPAN